jgi:peptidoglycan/xylan/chitin deacetylase (PgdA/CDA1 family)
MKAVMYHYVQEYNERLPNFRFLSIENFCKQLDYFDREFGIATREEWEAFVLRKRVPDRQGKVVLTFDDALSCHYEYVYPELVRRGLWGIFYVPTQPYAEGKMLDVHRIHLLCGAYNGADLYEAAHRLVTPEMMPHEKREEFRQQTYRRPEKDEAVSDFKRLMNYYIDDASREQVLEDVIRVIGFKESTENFYVPMERLKLMNENGMVIGSHTHSHPVMSKLGHDAQNREINNSFDFLERALDMQPKTYCHPYGGTRSYNQETLDALNKADVAYSFSVEYRDVSLEDVRNMRQCLPRFDCNQLPFGQAS